MYRRVVVYSPELTTGDIKILYRVYGGKLLSQQRLSTSNYNPSWDASPALAGIRFVGAYLLKTSSSLASVRPYEFIMEVDENQPKKESVEEATTIGVYIAVYNENGVIVCDNGKRNIMSTSDLGKVESTLTNAPGEMTSVPGEEPGEMSGETTGEPGAMI